MAKKVDYIKKRNKSILDIEYFASLLPERYFSNRSLKNLYYIDSDDELREEEWRDAIGFEGYYKVSNLGRVKSVNRIAVYKSGKLKTINQRILKQSVTIWGYCQVRVSKDNIKGKETVHRMVGMAFIENKESCPIINHKKGNKLDNRAWMLEWCTYSENAIHAYTTGLANSAKGEKSAASKLTESEVRQIKLLLSIGNYTQYRIAKMFGVSKITIFDIKENKTWKHVVI